MLKKLWMAFLFICCITFANHPKNQTDPQKGTLYVINAPKHATNYQFIEVPALRTLYKRNAVATYKSITGVTVIVTKVENVAGNTVVTLERKDGKKFFRHYQSITANAKKALEKGELSIAK